VEDKAWNLLQKIDAMGGSVAAIEQGFMQDEIARSAYEYQRKIESSEKIIVGVNKFGIGDEKAIPVFKIDDSIRDSQVQKLNVLKNKRDGRAVTISLDKIREHAVDGTNLMPAVVKAVECHATLGEVADVLRGVFGEHR
jgi:methylmalonyl-CoA mutase N-terminal domain/subunit